MTVLYNAGTYITIISYWKYFPATEAFDDDGLPHTLEHIIFMGSEKYPYKVCTQTTHWFL